MAGVTGTAPGVANAAGIGKRGNRTTGSAAGVANAAGIMGLRRVSQVAQLSSVESYPGINASQIALLALGAIPAFYFYNSQAVTLALTQVAAKQEHISQVAQLAPIQGKVVDQVSQVAVLSLVRADPGKRQLRTFTFPQDGHSFYVLHLGELGTIVYDQLTGKWSEWQSYLYNNWKANYGIAWNGGVIAGSIDSNIIYDVNPDYMFDERDQPIISVVTGGYPMRMRNSISCDEVMITSSVGYVPGTVNSQLQLRISDDFGLTYRDCGILDMTTATPKTEVSWRSLGLINAPGRIFQLTDLGGAAQRINSMEMFSRDINDG